jgi:hypothetical protein
MTANWAHLSGRDGHDRSGFPGQGDKLDLISLIPRIHVNNGSNITGLKSLLMKRCGQNHSGMFANHSSKILEGMRCDQSRGLGSLINDPDCSDCRRTAVWTGNRTVDPKLCSIS